MIAVICFVATLLLGVYICVIGVGLSAVYGGFTGKIPAAAIAASLVGVAIISAAFYFAPFTLVGALNEHLCSIYRSN